VEVGLAEIWAVINIHEVWTLSPVCPHFVADLSPVLAAVDFVSNVYRAYESFFASLFALLLSWFPWPCGSVTEVRSRKLSGARMRCLHAGRRRGRQETQLSHTGRATLRVVENLAVTQGRSMFFEITPLSKLSVSSY